MVEFGRLSQEQDSKSFERLNYLNTILDLFKPRVVRLGLSRQKIGYRAKKRV
jgi:hypothetical protein